MAREHDEGGSARVWRDMEDRVIDLALEGGLDLGTKAFAITVLEMETGTGRGQVLCLLDVRRGGELTCRSRQSSAGSEMRSPQESSCVARGELTPFRSDGLAGVERRPGPGGRAHGQRMCRDSGLGPACVAFRAGQTFSPNGTG
jgi:hypothetical protein